MVLQDELAVRADRQLQRRVKAAQFRDLKPLDSFDWSFNSSIKRKQIYELASGRFIRETRDVLFLGPPGVGKSFLIQAIGYQAIKSGFVVLYRSIFDVVRDFLRDEALGGADKVLTRYLKPDLLLIDDMGMKQLPKRSGECLFEIIMRRYETRSTVMTSNRPLEDWGKLLGDVPSATAIWTAYSTMPRSCGSQGRAIGCETLAVPKGRQAASQNRPQRPPGRKGGSRGQNRPKRPPGRRRSRGSQNQPKRPPGQRRKKPPSNKARLSPGPLLCSGKTEDRRGCLWPALERTRGRGCSR